MGLSIFWPPVDMYLFGRYFLFELTENQKLGFEKTKKLFLTLSPSDSFGLTHLYTHYIDISYAKISCQGQCSV